MGEWMMYTQTVMTTRAPLVLIKINLSGAFVTIPDKL